MAVLAVSGSLAGRGSRAKVATSRLIRALSKPPLRPSQWRRSAHLSRTPPNLNPSLLHRLANRIVAFSSCRTLLRSLIALPAVYAFRFFTELGGLLSYGNDLNENFRRAATYADRILKGEKPSELPVQAPVKFELVINLQAATGLGLTVPPTLLGLADKVIE
jgi:ABC transporter substrate binding protein